MAIPWIQLVKYAPSILSLTGDLLQRSRPPQSDVRGEAQDRLRAMEKDLQKQAEILHALAGQVQGLTLAVASLRRSLIAAALTAGTALLLAGAALIMALAQ